MKNLILILAICLTLFSCSKNETINIDGTYYHDNPQGFYVEWVFENEYCTIYNNEDLQSINRFSINKESICFPDGCRGYNLNGDVLRIEGVSYELTRR